METTNISYVTVQRDDNLCRACLSVNEDNRCIFDFQNNLQYNIYDTNELLWEKLQLYGGIKVSQNDNLPGIICNDCISKMNIAHEFRIQCQSSDKILRSIYTENAAEKNEETTECWLKTYKDDNERLQERCDEYLKSPDSCDNRENSKNIIEREANSRRILKADTTGNQCNDSDESIDVKEKLDKSKKQEYRSQRLILFKRATSLTNLKNNKQRQRHYIKKSFHSSAENVQRCSNLPQKYSNFCKSSRNGESEESCNVDDNYLSDDVTRLQVCLEDEKANQLEEILPACNICNKKFRKTVTLVRHLNVHKRDNPRAVYFILRDMRDRRRQKNVISSRDKYTNCDNFLVEDQDSMGEFICNECSEKFVTSDELTNHRDNCIVRRENNVNGEDGPPDDRSAIKMINIWIKEELESDNEGKGFSCENCEKFYATSKALSKHRAKIHGDIEYRVEGQEKTFTCSECNKIFLKESKLEKHSRIHARAKEQQETDFKRFLCHICSKTFRQNTGLMFHMRTHTGYKPHVCKYCGRGFTSNSNCINHERTHTGDRPFVCHFCSAAFAKSCTLKAHITTHTGEANYHCKTCGKSFRRLKYLKEHRFTHTGEKPYACKICGTAYSHSGSLFVHEKKCKAQEINQRLPILENECHAGSIVTTDTPQYVESIHEHSDDGKYYVESKRLDDTNDISTKNDIDEISSTSVRNFTVIGQMFHV